MNNTARLDKAIEMIVGTFVQVIGKEVSCYLEAYKAKMLMRDILEARWFSSFVRFVIARGNHNWEEFEREPLKVYGFDDYLKMPKKDFLDLVDSPDKR